MSYLIRSSKMTKALAYYRDGEILVLQSDSLDAMGWAYRTAFFDLHSRGAYRDIAEEEKYVKDVFAKAMKGDLNAIISFVRARSNAWSVLKCAGQEKRRPTCEMVQVVLYFEKPDCEIGKFGQ